MEIVQSAATGRLAAGAAPDRWLRLTLPRTDLGQRTSRIGICPAIGASGRNLTLGTAV